MQTAILEIDKAQTGVKAAQDEVQRAKQDVASVHQTIAEKTEELKKWTDDAADARRAVDDAIRHLISPSNAVDPMAVVSVALDPLMEAPVVAQIRRPERLSSEH